MGKNALRPFLIRNRKVYPFWISRFIAVSIAFISGILFVAKFAGPSFLRLYIESGIGTCQKIPILCMSPEGKIYAYINKGYIPELLPYRFPKMEIYLPAGVTAVEQEISRVYKKDKYYRKGRAVYLLYKEPNFFINLFPRVKKQKIFDDYEFIKRIMYVQIKDIKDFDDAFFVIMKGIFSPDLGNQNNVKMAEFRIGDKRGFINYNLSKPDYYFDCNVINGKEGFFKIYIRDKGGSLDLDKVLAIISTVKKSK